MSSECAFVSGLRHTRTYLSSSGSSSVAGSGADLLGFSGTLPEQPGSVLLESPAPRRRCDAPVVSDAASVFRAGRRCAGSPGAVCNTALFRRIAG